MSHVTWLMWYDSDLGIMQQFLYQGRDWYSLPRYLHKITFRNENQGVQWYLHRVPSDYSSLKKQQFEFHVHMHFRPCSLLFRLLHKKHAKCVYDGTFNISKWLIGMPSPWGHRDIILTSSWRHHKLLTLKYSLRNMVAHFINLTSWIFSIFFSLKSIKNLLLWSLAKVITLITLNLDLIGFCSEESFEISPSKASTQVQVWMKGLYPKGIRCRLIEYYHVVFNDSHLILNWSGIWLSI